MSKFLTRVLHSPRLGRVVFAALMPASIGFAFLPVWGILASLGLVIGAVLYFYAEVLSPKFVQKQSKSTQDQVAALAAAPPVEESALQNQVLQSWESLGQEISSQVQMAQIELGQTMRESEHAALKINAAVRNLQSVHETQTHLTRELLAQSTPKLSADASLVDLARQASLELRRLSEDEHLAKAFGAKDLHRLAELLEYRLDQTSRTVAAMKELQLETAEHVDQAIIGLQYHDITSQTLSAVRNEILQSIDDRTQAQLRAGANSSDDTSIEHDQVISTLSSMDAQIAPKARKHTSKEVELFAI